MNCPNCGRIMEEIVEDNPDVSSVDWCANCGTISSVKGEFGSQIPYMGIILRNGYGEPMAKPEPKKQ